MVAVGQDFGEDGLNPAIRIIFAPLSRHKSPQESNVQGLNWGGRTRTIYIDPRFGNAARTLLHEFLHTQHRDWSESKVWAEERRQWKKMTWQEKAKLYRLLGKGKIKGESND